MSALRAHPTQVQIQRRCHGAVVPTSVRNVASARYVLSLAPAQRGRPVYSIGKDALDGFLDVSKLVSGGGGSKTPYDDFASAIGRDVYVDLAGWHLYLRDMGTGVSGSSLKMSQALAQQFGPQLNKGLREDDVEDLLRKIPVKLGGGKLKTSLYEVMPSMCVGDLVRLCEEFSRR